ncbi:putative LsmAD domain, ataxin 2, SM domain-containing protein [Medicago truncatula]|uniref:Putative LsmAD domain, ataxin 2, SM domain-containing protein n=1 Tax=Medicago truncatula TaxID=3880 RepID=A0A396JHN4_MEDTR|nr:polyadenylate-binding protein-interacting protein 3 isoform X1 [Medicago truncatula]RHN76231.1 putative LsmAD domain, ataxin 2, SM domain-containing protein [Medicago truncatula]
MSLQPGQSKDGSSHDRLVYVTTCLIGQQVEIQVKNGSIYSGIFHATDTDKDFGIILKMARLTKDASSQGKKSGAEFVSKAPSKILIIPAKELVQVIAQGVAVTKDGLPSEPQHGRNQEIMVDSLISQSHHAELGRELEPWVPDEDDPQCPELDNIFDGHWNRGWDQFATNKALFGVKSTFNEELYTTKLEKGPRTRELELQALRIEREIEGEETQDLHLAEERGLHLDGEFDIDEETRFSSVYRGKHVDDAYEENEDMLMDSHNSEMFSGIFGSVDERSDEMNSGEGNDAAHALANSSFMDRPQSSQSNTGVDLSRSSAYDHAKQFTSEIPSKSYSFLDGESRIQENPVHNLRGASGNTKEENLIVQQGEDVQLSKYEDSQASLYFKKDGSDKGVLSPNASSYAPSSHISLKSREKTGSPGDSTEGLAYHKANGATKYIDSRGASSGSDSVRGVAGSSGPGLSPSSSVGSLSSEKSSLNLNAKEFKLNSNAKSFIPSPARSPTPVSDSSFYFQPNVTTVPSMPGVPMSIGVGPSYIGHQPIIYNPQVSQMPTQAYFHPNAPQYGQLLGHPTQALYMPSYQPEML